MPRDRGLEPPEQAWPNQDDHLDTLAVDWNGAEFRYAAAYRPADPHAESSVVTSPPHDSAP
jgi:hypothetical protein